MNKLIKFFTQREVFHDGTEGDTLFEVLLSTIALAAFFVLMTWVLFAAPGSHQHDHRQPVQQEQTGNRG
ncbi:hypothetical protein [Salinisphaera sp. G21_0]|uniref:hypothetical protein n=1 Tax=Salinisphaera sp. G21_0 TaxID=2821094 RepID=UPI001ADD3F11|nr:hypothetical protein [Salinisphaera sp. G21_0]MBO9484340.1 hypothetical protein [Salinisphaera sp. G21_0]